MEDEIMAKITILFEEGDVKYCKERIPLKMQFCLSALANSYDIDENLFYLIFILGCECSKNN